jgi:hypothetical protein
MTTELTIDAFLPDPASGTAGSNPGMGKRVGVTGRDAGRSCAQPVSVGA